MNHGKRILAWLRGFFPTALPLGMTELDQFSESIFDLYGIPNTPTFQHNLAAMIQHLGPTTAYKSKFWFNLALKKAMANEIAYHKIHFLKEEAKKQAQQKQAEDTAQSSGASDEQKPA